MFWKIVIGMIVFTVSCIVTPMLITMPMCCVNMGIPFSRQVQRDTGVNTSKLRSMYVRSTLLYAIINAVIAIVLHLFVPTFYCYMVLAGVVITLLRSIGPSFSIASNLEDWINSCMKYMGDNELEIVFGYIQTRFQSK